MTVSEVSLFDTKTIYSIMKSASLGIIIISTFVGISLGLVHAAEGIASASLYKGGVAGAVASCVFITTPLVLSIMGFFTLRGKDIDSYTRGGQFLTSALLLGLPGFLASVFAGEIARSSTITLAKQKKFTSQFVVIFIFVELVPILGLVLSIFVAKDD